MGFMKLSFILVLLCSTAWAKQYDSASLQKTTNYKGLGLCHLTGDIKDISFDSSVSTRSCSQVYGDNFVLVGVSTADSQTKTIHCQKLSCNYMPDTTNQAVFYKLPSH